MRRGNSNNRNYYGNQRDERYDDSFGSRNYRSSYNFGEGPYGTHYQPGDQYPYEDNYYERGRHYHSDRWYNGSDPYEEELRDEYDRYGVGLSRGRYYGEPYGSTYRGNDEHFGNWEDNRAGSYHDERHRDGEHHGFFSRAGERIRDTWNHWRGRDERDADDRNRRDERRNNGRMNHQNERRHSY